ncbi:MAG: phosphatidate cytidylyltransferase [Eubacteriales bacterium]|nr:phosphatidate cytidylyltransferase [Eubacteriales bacterium]
MAQEYKANIKISSFITRAISGLILLILSGFIMYQGGDLLFFASMIVSVIGLIELLRIFKLSKSSLGFFSYFLTFVYYFILYENKSYVVYFIIILLLGLLIFYVVKYPKYNINDVAICFFGVTYVAIMFSFVYLIRLLNYGSYFVWLVFISSWGSDTCAYCIGSLFGKHKLTPLLSPKKSIEGSIAGVLGSALLGILFVFLSKSILNLNINAAYVGVAFACMMGAIISQFGDLAASGIKRDYNTKDYGDIIPGHGGILDRFDSVIFAAPAVYFTLLLFS